LPVAEVANPTQARAIVMIPNFVGPSQRSSSIE
jgi:hypothetical protein